MLAAHAGPPRNPDSARHPLRTNHAYQRHRPGPRRPLARRRGWSVLVVLAVGVQISTSLNAPESPVLRLLAGPLAIAAVLLTSVGHELGHALASLLHGLTVRAIVLAPQGGGTIRAGRTAPASDITTALAGPLANLLLGAACMWALLACAPSPYVTLLLLQVTLLQVVTAAANLLPWGPMDGRRIVTAWQSLSASP